MTLNTLFNQIKIYGYIKAETVNDNGKELKHIEYDRKDGTHVEYDKLCNAEEETSKKKKEMLSDNIEIILHGTEKQKEKLKSRYFKLNDTPEEFKQIGLNGEFFQTKFGTISRHKNKDNEHSFSADEWRAICKNLAIPEKCIITQTPGRDDFNIYTKIGKSIMVGVTVKSPSRNILRNNIETTYRAEPRQNEKILFPKDTKKATSAQQTLLARLNPGTYTADTCHIIMLTLDEKLSKLIYRLLNEL